MVVPVPMLVSMLGRLLGDSGLSLSAFGVSEKLSLNIRVKSSMDCFSEPMLSSARVKLAFIERSSSATFWSTEEVCRASFS